RESSESIQMGSVGVGVMGSRGLWGGETRDGRRETEGKKPSNAPIHSFVVLSFVFCLLSLSFISRLSSAVSRLSSPVSRLPSHTTYRLENACAKVPPSIYSSSPPMGTP